HKAFFDAVNRKQLLRARPRHHWLAQIKHRLGRATVRTDLGRNRIGSLWLEPGKRRSVARLLGTDRRLAPGVALWCGARYGFGGGLRLRGRATRRPGEQDRLGSNAADLTAEIVQIDREPRWRALRSTRWSGATKHAENVDHPMSRLLEDAGLFLSGRLLFLGLLAPLLLLGLFSGFLLVLTALRDEQRP